MTLETTIGGSKNNPRNRNRIKLIIYCPKCKEPMKLVKKVPGGMFHVCTKDENHCFKSFKQSYKRFNHEWIDL